MIRIAIIVLVMATGASAQELPPLEPIEIRFFKLPITSTSVIDTDPRWGERNDLQLWPRAAERIVLRRPPERPFRRRIPVY